MYHDFLGQNFTAESSPSSIPQIMKTYCTDCKVEPVKQKVMHQVQDTENKAAGKVRLGESEETFDLLATMC